MKSCGDIRDAVLRGESLSDPETAKHLADCSACAALVEQPELFADALRGSDRAVPAADVDALFGRVSGAIGAERGPFAYLRSRPTWMRGALAMGAALATALAILLLRPRPDLDAYPPGRMLMIIAVLGALIVVSSALTLRPAHRLAPAVTSVYAAVAAALAGLLALAMLPRPEAPHPPSPALAELLAGAWGCFSVGLLLALPVLIALHALDRGTHRFAVLVAAGCGGVTANLALHLHCANTYPAHLVAGHVTVAAALISLGALAMKLRR